MTSNGGLPFAGIRERPYDQKTLTGVDRTQFGVTEFYVDTLWLTQQRLTITGIFQVEPFSTDVYPHVVGWNGEFYVEDGHHRLVAEVLRMSPLGASKRPTVRARLIALGYDSPGTT